MRTKLDELYPRGPRSRSWTGGIENYVPEPNSGCWLWLGGTFRNGYAHVRVGGKSRLGHIVMYELFKGAVPAGLQLDHLCRVRSCINPDHLQPVTARENMRRSPVALAGINAKKTACIHGHNFTEENTGWWAGKRYCRECSRQRDRIRKKAIYANHA